MYCDTPSLLTTPPSRTTPSAVADHRDRFARPGAGGCHAVVAAVAAGGLQSFGAEVAGVVGPYEWRDHDVAGLQRGHLRADVLHDAEELVGPMRLPSCEAGMEP